MVYATLFIFAPLARHKPRTFVPGATPEKPAVYVDMRRRLTHLVIQDVAPTICCAYALVERKIRAEGELPNSLV